MTDGGGDTTGVGDPQLLFFDCPSAAATTEEQQFPAASVAAAAVTVVSWPEEASVAAVLTVGSAVGVISDGALTHQV